MQIVSIHHTARRLNLAAITCLLLIADTTLLAGSYYVSPCGSNMKNGLSANCGGGVNGPFETLVYAVRQLQVGDTLFVRGGTYANNFVTIDPDNGTVNGTESQPMVVMPYANETPVLKLGKSIIFDNASWWVLEGLTFETYEQSAITMGRSIAIGHSETKHASNIVIRDCQFLNANGGSVVIHNASNILLEDCSFSNIRFRSPFYNGQGQQIGMETNAIALTYAAESVSILNCTFEDIGSDGVHIGTYSSYAGSQIGDVTIDGCDFSIRRPYLFRDENGNTPPGAEDSLDNVGENAIDVKTVTGSVVISGSTFTGFRPTSPRQDASGGAGKAITLHQNTRTVTIERNFFDDNVVHVGNTAGGGVPYGTRFNVIRNNIFKRAIPFSEYGESFDGTGVQFIQTGPTSVYFNTFYENDYSVYATYSRQIEFRNNLFYGGKLFAGNSNRSWSPGNNAFYNVEGEIPIYLQGPGDLYPTVVGLDTISFSLNPNSPLVDAGTDVAVYEDYYRTVRAQGAGFDIGAYEVIASAAGVRPLPGTSPAVLEQNVPNPFNPSTTIQYTMIETGRVDLSVFNSAGQRIRRLVDELKEPGMHTVVWNGKNESGLDVASGVYYLRLQTGFTNVLFKKMILLR